MRKVILSEWISLDGYVSDKDGQLSFFASLVRATYTEPGQVKFLETIDTILMGRKTYEQFVQPWPGRPIEEEPLAEKMNMTRKIIFSHTLKHAPWGNWAPAEIAKGDAISTVKQLKQLPGKNIIVWASISLAHALMKENLIDEYRLFICPVLISGNRKLFPGEMDSTTLQLLESTHYNSGVVSLSYEVLNKV
ncbi:MAG TPA: dihydrofolate reductase family protein [Chitinophagaceae bacterium]|nr:dihydrofolate reductase family protein [Chitinophagaceae bacterium]